MYDGYKVVCVTPAGRRRYMKILAPYILSCPLIDEYQIWVNTRDEDDLQFMRDLAAAHPRVTLVSPPRGDTDGTSTSIYQFFRTTLDCNTIYIRLDDDIVYLSENFFEELLKFRVENPQYFLVTPTIINNAVCSFILETRFSPLSNYGMVEPYVLDKLGWKNGKFAQHLHNLFLHKHARGTLGDWRFDKQEMGAARFSINCISWFGREFAAFGGVIDKEEEHYVSAVKPTALGKINAVTGRAMACHFAYYPQRDLLDQTDILERYEALCLDTFGADAERLSAGYLQPPPGMVKLSLNEQKKKYADLSAMLQKRMEGPSRWVFSRSDGLLISNVTLLPHGKLGDYNHHDEDGWAIREGDLCFLKKDGTVSTRYEHLSLDANNRLRAEGPYLLNMVDYRHVLTEAA